MEDVLPWIHHTLTQPLPNAKNMVSFHISTGRYEVKTLVDCHTHWMGGLLDSEVGKGPNVQTMLRGAREKIVMYSSKKICHAVVTGLTQIVSIVCL